MTKTTTKLSDERIDQLLAAKKVGATNRELAMRFGISAATVSDYVTGKRGKSEAQPSVESADVAPVDRLADYNAYVERKLTIVPPTGIAGANVTDDRLFPHARALTSWALRRGRAGIFAATGLAKSSMEGAYGRAVAEHTGKPFLILTPLAVAPQMKRECERIGTGATVIRSSADVQPGINVCNYQRLHLLDPSVFGGVAFDESSLFKNYNAKTLADAKQAFDRTPFRLSATATPAPNDITELCTQAEILGICTRSEMLSEYFVHDGGDTQTWRLKGHAQVEFWKFVASWAALIRTPEDLGFDGSAYKLPPLNLHMHTIAASDEQVRDSGHLFAQPAAGLTAQRSAYRASMAQRVRQCAELVASEPNERWVLWCELNQEQDELAEALGGECASVYGSLDIDEKEERIERFISGDKRILLTKSRISGWGLNLQFCARMAFVGISNSWEAYHQDVRRIWRFGQQRPCEVHIFASELEGNVVKNLQRKEAEAAVMAEALARETSEIVRAEVFGQTRRANAYKAPAINLPSWMKGTGT